MRRLHPAAEQKWQAVSTPDPFDEAEDFAAYWRAAKFSALTVHGNSSKSSRLAASVAATFGANPELKPFFAGRALLQQETDQPYFLPGYSGRGDSRALDARRTAGSTNSAGSLTSEPIVSYNCACNNLS